MTDRLDWQDAPQEVIGKPQNIMYMHSRCHINSPTWTKVDFDLNQAIIECAECGKEIMRLKLEERKSHDQ